MSTAARVSSERASHWYYLDGQPCFELPKADGKGTKSPTLADARKLNLLPSVTNILRVTNKPALNEWLTEQAVLAVLSTPRLDGETLDAFVHRVLHEEKVQDEEAALASKLGTDIHDALEKALNNQEWDRSLAPYIEPVVGWVRETGKVMWTERNLVGEGYAGRADLQLDCESLNAYLMTDFKSTGTVPKASYPEHRLQTSAYLAAAPIEPLDKHKLLTCNVYISTKEPGKFAHYIQDDWAHTYVDGFEHILRYWQWLNRYVPMQNVRN